MKSIQGFSLLELLLACGLGIGLIAGLTGLYLTTKSSWQFILNNVQLQANAQIAITLLNQTIRMAGYVGCGNSNAVLSAADIPDFTADKTIVGWHAGASSSTMALPASIQQAILPGSDALLVQSMAEPITMVIDPSLLILSDKPDYQIGDTLLISDCQHLEAFHLVGMTATAQGWQLSPEHALQHHYQGLVQIGKLQQIIFYVGLSQPLRHNKTGLPINVLYRRDLQDRSRTPTELVDNISNLQLCYRQETSARELSPPLLATAVTDWSQVKIVNIALLVNSGEVMLNQPTAYSYLGQQFMPNNRLFYQEWDAGVGLRERVF